MSDAPQATTVLDIEAERFGKTYARAILAAAVSAGVADEVLGQLDEVVDGAVRENPSLAAAFASPRIDEQEKLRVIDRLFGSQVHPILLHSLKVMARRGRLQYLQAVRDAAAEMHDEMMGRVVAEVRTAVPLSDELRNEVSRRIADALHREVRLRNRVDESLLGGMVIRIGDTVYDASVAGRIDEIGRAASRGFAQALLERSGRFVAER